MYAVPAQPEKGELLRIERRPRSSNWMMREHWTFISERQPWDADEREWIARATGLYCLSSEYGLHEADAWWKLLAREYVRHRDTIEAVRVADLNAAD